MLVTRRSMRPTISRFFNDDWNSLFDWSEKPFTNGESTLPSVNVIENTDAFLVEMAAPGMKKEDFSIQLENNTLTIKGESQLNEENKEDEHYTRQEFRYCSFQRSFNFDTRIVDEESINAEYTDGVLKLRLPKKEEAKPKPAKLIEIS